MMPQQTTTDPQDELLTEVDEHDHVIGAIPRGIAHRSPDRIYRNIFVMVKDSGGKILIQQRSSTKDLYPDCWDLSVGGHVKYGDTYEQTAIKELAEELGLTAAEHDLKLLGEVMVVLPASKELFHVFEYMLKPTDVIKLASDEISSTRWMTIEEIHDSIRNRTLPWYGRPEQVLSALYPSVT
jgi:isopentenyldiphosphate isomerase